VGYITYIQEILFSPCSFLLSGLLAIIATNVLRQAQAQKACASFQWVDL